LPVLVIFLMGDLLWFDYGRNLQCDPSFYYPKIPVLDEVAQSVPGRVIGVDCLPASLAIMQGLNDIRGYDAIDPARMVALLKTAAVPGLELPFAAIKCMIPQGHTVPPSTVQFPPVLDMLGVRYAIFGVVLVRYFIPCFKEMTIWSWSTPTLFHAHLFPSQLLQQPVMVKNWKCWLRRSSIQPTWHMSNPRSNCRLRAAAPFKSQMKFRPASRSRRRWKPRD